jgi:hypothetical protein
VKESSDGQVENLLFFGYLVLVATKQGMTAFLENKKDTLATVIHQFRQVGETERTLPVFFLMSAEGLNGQKKVADNFRDLPLSVSLEGLQLSHPPLPGFLGNHFILRLTEKQEYRRV